MPSSTSSSERSKIPVALATAAALVFAYAILAPRLFPEGGLPEGTQQENIARVEDWLFAPTPARVVIVGSSEAARLEPSMLPSDFANLSFAGGSAQTGLRILEAAIHKPAVVLVEVNDTLLREVDPDLAARAEPGWRNAALFAIPALRQRYQPIGILGRWLKNLSDRRIGTDSLDDAPPANFAANILPQLEDVNIPLDPTTATQRSLQLFDRIRKLRAAGVRVLLFDPPIDPTLYNGSRRASFRREMRIMAGGRNVIWVPDVDPFRYHTSDGVHLLPGSASRYANYLAQQVLGSDITDAPSERADHSP